MSTTNAITRPIEASDPGRGFKCGEHALGNYFVRHAWSNDQSGIARAFVFEQPAADVLPQTGILGFYCLSMAEVDVASATPMLDAKRLPKYPMPVALIGRFAVSQSAQGQGIGRLLLGDALNRVADLSPRIGFVGVIVDAKNDRAQQFCEARGFRNIAVVDGRSRMFLPKGSLSGSQSATAASSR